MEKKGTEISVISASAHKKRNRRSYCNRNVRCYLAEYCDNSSIHGLRYLGERKRSLTEKIWWLLFLAVALCICIRLIYKTYQKWERVPVVVTLATSETPISEIPFPAITICPEVKASKKKFNFTEAMIAKEESDEEISQILKDKLEYMWLVCYNTRDSEYFYDEFETDEIYDQVLDFLLSVQEPIEKSIKIFCWAGQEFTYERNYFTPTVTSEGVCFSFNLIDRDELFTDNMSNNDRKGHHQPPSKWTLESGFDKNSNFSDMPRRTSMTGSSGGLYMTLEVLESDLDYICGDACQGYKVFVHHPGQIPNANRGYIRLGLDQDVTIAVKPSMMVTSEELRHYSPKHRKCYFNEEKTLTFFKVYDQQNCLSECLSNFTLQLCKCVGFFMPRNKSTPICSLSKIFCLEKAGARFLSKKENGNMTCNCLPSCTSLDFDVEVSQSEWNWRAADKMADSLGYGDTRAKGPHHRSRLQVFFKDMQFITMERNELYGQTDFLASCGGLLGLFTGFSLISLIEILYFATLRLFCNLKRHGQIYHSGQASITEAN